MANSPIRVLVVAGSGRRETNCPAADSKAVFFAERVKEKLPKDWVVDVLNLGNDYVLPKIQSCNACVSTSMALCVWPCNCYKRHSFSEPDLMWDEDVYGRIYAADAILVCSPVNWYTMTSNLKLMFDRLVCANGGNPDEDLIGHKDGELAAKLEHSPEWKELSVNHLEGRTAGFFIYGDEGGDEIDSDGRPKILRHKEYFNPEGETRLGSTTKFYGPLIWQCRYSGIEVPESLVKQVAFGGGGKYSDNQIRHVKKNKEVLEKFDSWVNNVKVHVEKKGKVPLSKYPVPFRKPDSAMHPFLRQLQLLARTVLGNLYLHSIGYFASRYYSKKLRLFKHYQERGMKDVVKKIYGKIAKKEQKSCCGPTCCSENNKSVSEKLGYTKEELASIPEGSNMGLGCGNPVALASLKEGETVVDLGSGGGLDVFLAARKVGPRGKAIGIDMTQEMLDKANKNAARSGLKNVEFKLGDIENIPLEDNTADCIISNCVINLAEDKQKVFNEAFRILKPGGRLMVSDMVLLLELPKKLVECPELYAGCIAGALLKDDYIGKIKTAGFSSIEVQKEDPVSVTDYIGSDKVIGELSKDMSADDLKKIDETVVSVKISARKGAAK